MHNYCKTIGAMAAASALVAGNASAELEGEIHAGYSSQYIFRGQDLGTDLVEAGADLAYEWNGLGLSAGAWYGSYESNFNPGVSENSLSFDELDLYTEVSKDLGFMNVSVGYIYYRFLDLAGDVSKNSPLDSRDAQEVYFSVGRDFGFLDASLTYFWDVETDNDGYSELALGKSFELNQCLTLNVGGTLGYLVEEGHLSHFTTRVSVDWGFAGTAKLSPFLAHSWDLSGGQFDDVVTTSSSPGAQNEFIGGAMVSVGF